MCASGHPRPSYLLAGNGGPLLLGQGHRRCRQHYVHPPAAYLDGHYGCGYGSGLPGSFLPYQGIGRQQIRLQRCSGRGSSGSILRPDRDNHRPHAGSLHLRGRLLRQKGRPEHSSRPWRLCRLCLRHPAQAHLLRLHDVLHYRVLLLIPRFFFAD